MSYPDLPHIPELPSHRTRNMSVAQVLDAAQGALHAAEEALVLLDDGAPAVVQLGLIRYVVIECRRSTLVLQKLSSRVQRFDEWYQHRQEVLAADPLMRYFKNLRNQIEKEGLPGTMAEVVDRSTGTTIADVACGEGSHGIWVSGAMRSGVRFESGTMADSSERVLLTNFRLPDPPNSHRGVRLEDRRFSTLASLAIEFLWQEVVGPARVEFTGATDAGES